MWADIEDDNEEIVDTPAPVTAVVPQKQETPTVAVDKDLRALNLKLQKLRQININSGNEQRTLIVTKQDTFNKLLTCIKREKNQRKKISYANELTRTAYKNSTLPEFVYASILIKLRDHNIVRSSIFSDTKSSFDIVLYKYIPGGNGAEGGNGEHTMLEESVCIDGVYGELKN